MGYMAHHAMVFTSWDNRALAKVHAEAARIGANPTQITPEAVNGYVSFMVPPDGSKEGWEESDSGDWRRRSLMGFVSAMAYGDGSNSVHFVSVRFGGDEPWLCAIEGTTRENPCNKS